MSTSERSLRLGLLLEGERIPRWQSESIERLLTIQGVLPVALILEERRNEAPRTWWQRMRQGDRRTAFYRNYRRRRFHPHALEVVDLASDLAHVKRLFCASDPERGRPHFSATDLETLRGLQLDVLLTFEKEDLNGEILDLPRYGVWTFHLGDEQKYRGGPAGFWEIVRNEPLMAASLLRLIDGGDRTVVMRKGWCRIMEGSWAATLDGLLGGIAHWPAQVCRELLANDMTSVDVAPTEMSKRVSGIPGNSVFLQFKMRQLRDRSRRERAELTTHGEWNIGVLYQPITSLLEDVHSLNVRWLPSPSKGAMRSEPTGYIAPDGQLNVLYHKFDHALGKGEIARVRPKRDNILKRSRVMLTSTKHLGQPFIVTHEGVVYCLVAETDRVGIYRVNETNEALDEVGTFLDQPLRSPTLFEHQGRWWLMGTRSPLEHAALHIYSSDRFEGPYVAHPLNPVKIDARSAQPGGTPFRNGEELWRPAQDHTLGIGHRIALNRVDVLTPEQFRETTVKTIGPIKGQYPFGLRTLASVGAITVVDGMRSVHLKAQEDHVRRQRRRRGVVEDEDRS